ncbi:unnamed protein product [Ceutorhynchus assimilis]|uniref:Uncharacterized protein n=1 Tax=Ceutorhynchus assimilis TaxID=467358 RepID=A0A9N9MPB2_9CUCU|nr:unnamed protein product [Ceutorhynchus assimilis]
MGFLQYLNKIGCKQFKGLYFSKAL